MMNEKTIGENGKSTMAKKCILLFLLTGIFVANASAATQTIGVLDSFGDKLLKLCTAKWLKAILAVILMISIGAAAYGNQQGADGMVRNGLRWAIGSGLILGATSVVNYFFSGISPESLAFLENSIDQGISFINSIAA